MMPEEGRFAAGFLAGFPLYYIAHRFLRFLERKRSPRGDAAEAAPGDGGGRAAGSPGGGRWRAVATLFAACLFAAGCSCRSIGEYLDAIPPFVVSLAIRVRFLSGKEA
jgi:hypothetical protein